MDDVLKNWSRHNDCEAVNRLYIYFLRQTRNAAATDADFMSWIKTILDDLRVESMARVKQILEGERLSQTHSQINSFNQSNQSNP